MMTRDEQREIRDAMRLESFVRGGLAQLVKVLPLATGVPATVSGYVTQERFLLGKTPSEIERILGLTPNSLAGGCRIMALSRLPGISEIEYDLTTHYPGGLAASALSDPRYPAAECRSVHQWRLTAPVPARLLRQLDSQGRYSSAHASSGS